MDGKGFMPCPQLLLKTTHTHTHTPYAIPGKYFQAEDKSLKTLAFVYFITSE